MVDDSPGLRIASKLILESLGFYVDLAAGVVEALQIYDHTPEGFSCVITDLDMPGLSGEDLVKELNHRGFKNKIVLISGKLEEDHVRSFKTLGVEGFVKKPFTEEKLSQVLLDLLG